MAPNGNALNLSGYLFYSFFLHFYGLSIHAKEYMYVYIRTCDGRKHNFFSFFSRGLSNFLWKIGRVISVDLKTEINFNSTCAYCFYLLSRGFFKISWRPFTEVLLHKPVGRLLYSLFNIMSGLLLRHSLVLCVRLILFWAAYFFFGGGGISKINETINDEREYKSLRLHSVSDGANFLFCFVFFFY
jgi:hypothetical protein